jgi:dynein heavy chain, axonemal
MMAPDFALIAEITLFSEGFAGAKALARKMAAIMDLSQQQLSKQDHYDYGGGGG